MSRRPLEDRIRALGLKAPLLAYGGNSQFPQSRARQLVYVAVRMGALVRGACEHCGSNQRTHAHHHDYFLPLDITWLCIRCHSAEHSRLYREGITLPGAGVSEVRPNRFWEAA